MSLGHSIKNSISGTYGSMDDLDYFFKFPHWIIWDPLIGFTHTQKKSVLESQSLRSLHRGSGANIMSLEELNFFFLDFLRKSLDFFIKVATRENVAKLCNQTPQGLHILSATQIFSLVSYIFQEFQHNFQGKRIRGNIIEEANK